ncbi:hypothetical protein BJ741DRAFT_616916 [Chytriomyces cf. hyalinus JEL632]|nr:hypothetical protein BJ741DRAFT_616916 [Chytriomyces cf. hyalinus JEL632]
MRTTAFLVLTSLAAAVYAKAKEESLPSDDGTTTTASASIATPTSTSASVSSSISTTASSSIASSSSSASNAPSTTSTNNPVSSSSISSTSTSSAASISTATTKAVVTTSSPSPISTDKSCDATCQQFNLYYENAPDCAKVCILAYTPSLAPETGKYVNADIAAIANNDWEAYYSDIYWCAEDVCAVAGYLEEALVAYALIAAAYDKPATAAPKNSRTNSTATTNAAAATGSVQRSTTTSAAAAAVSNQERPAPFTSTRNIVAASSGKSAFVVGLVSAFAVLFA